jgi:signal-transduction protein with cAMP-binding, CBS, and nucleotidyltransferase domain
VLVFVIDKLKTLIGFAIDEMGPPPARFVFMVLGSEGRKEQTLKTDQDNAIIIEDLPAKAAMQPVVDYARIYALNHRVAETKSLGRLRELLNQKKLSAQQYQELDTVYSYLMQQRFVRQVKASIEKNGNPDNYINPKKLSRIEQTTLKEIFKRIEKFQAKLSFDFTGLT